VARALARKAWTWRSWARERARAEREAGEIAAAHGVKALADRGERFQGL